MPRKKAVELNDLMVELQKTLANELLRAVKSGEDNASMLNVARQFLKDNHMEIAVTNMGNDEPELKLMESLKGIEFNQEDFVQ